MASQKLIPIRMNLDLAAENLDSLTARFIKNMTTSVGATDEYGIKEGQNELKQKPLQSTQIYAPVNLPEGDCIAIGAKGFPQTNEVYVFVWNSLKSHLIYRINGNLQICEIVKIDPDFNFQLDPVHFLGQCQITLDITPLGKELKWTDGFNHPGYLRPDDSIATNGFDPATFPYFIGTYDRAAVLRMGVPTPKPCISITEVPRVTDPTDPNNDIGANNNILYNKWYFIVGHTDVWGRPSEWSARSIEYVPGVNDCMANSNSIPRCLDLEIDCGSPFINAIDIAWKNCNTDVFHKEETVFLYDAPNNGAWWTRGRNQKVTYNPTTNTITYRFCRSKECQVVPVEETNRLENPIPQISQAIVSMSGFTGLLNNTSKFNPFPQELTSLITATVTPPQKQTDLGLRTITVLVPIWNHIFGNWQQVRKVGNKYLWGSNNFLHGGAAAYKQEFKNETQQSFCMYLVGGGSVIGKQVYVDAAGQLVDDVNFNGTSLSPIGLTFQQFTFTNVQKGKYIARLSSHLSDPNTDANYRNTSTTVWGVCPFAPQSGFGLYPNDRTRRTQELFIDVCNGDYNSLNDNKVLVIADLAGFSGSGFDQDRVWRASSGYIYETNSNGYNEKPMELLNVIGANGVTSIITDHNGFYWYETRGRGRTFAFDFIYKCAAAQFRVDAGPTGMRLADYSIDLVNNGQFSDYATAPCNRILITGRMTLQPQGFGIANTLVVLSRGQVASTNDNGEFTIIAHDDVLSYLNGGTRNDFVLISSGCGYTGVGNTCIQQIQVVIQRCTTCSERVISIGNADLEYISERGLLSGGVYGFGVVGFNWLGQATFVQPLDYINIPSIVQSQAIGASQVSVTIAPSATFPVKIEYIRFFITKETTTETYLDWIVDRFTFIDSSGFENNTAPTQIKIYYNSIIQYSKIHNYNTTTAWQFIPEGQNRPAVNDKVYFYLNGDGKFFTKAITAQVRYDDTGDYFLIDYTSDLKDLKANALIRIMRPKNCAGNEDYYEICSSRVDIVNGKAQKNNLVLDAFDTYYISRQIPVPAPPATGNTTVQIITNTPTGQTVATPPTIPTVIELRTFGFRFEHHAPSNFWGDGCSMVGRVNVKNPYESEITNYDQIALSGALSVNGQLNYLSYFDDKKMTSFDNSGSGGITGAIYDVGSLYVIAKNNNYLVGWNDNLGRVNADGTFQAGSIPNSFGKPQRRPGDTYGCFLEDKMTIQSRNGNIWFLDRNRAALMRYDYSKVNIVTENLCDAWMKAKVKSMQKNKARYFSSAIDPVSANYVLTDFNIEKPSYINNERSYNHLVNETVCFDLSVDETGKNSLRMFTTPTPENYAYLDGDVLNRQLFLMKNGIPNSHYNNNVNNSYNTFFGVQGEKILRVVCNETPLSDKMFLTVSVYCENQKFFADEITTSAKQKSRIMLEGFDKGGYFTFGAFRCDLNSVSDPNIGLETGANKIVDGDKLYGKWADIRLIGDISVNNKYCEITGIIVDYFTYQKSGG